MKSNYSIIFLLLLGFVTLACWSEESKIQSKTLPFEVGQIYPPISHYSSELKMVEKVGDLNPYFDRDWIKEYVSIEIKTVKNGKSISIKSNSEKLTQEQKRQLIEADQKAEIKVIIEYLPDNKLKKNEVQTMEFSTHKEPENSAKFKGGQEKLENYLHEKAIQFIPENTITGYALATVTFTIDEKGKVKNPLLDQSTSNQEIDDLLIQTVLEMPDWEPATFEDGEKTSQEFALFIGNMESCNLNLFHVSRNKRTRDE